MIKLNNITHYSVLYMNGVKRVNPESSHHKENRFFFLYLQFSSVQLLSHVRLFATPWIAARQASLSFTITQSLLKLMSTESVMRFNHLILCHSLSHSVQFSSVQSLSRVRLCSPMNCSTPGLPDHHQLPEFTQTHVHRVSDAIQLSHPLSSSSPPAPNPSQH